MSELLDTIRDFAEGQIDFQGQKLSETIGTVALVVAGFFAVVIGYITQDIRMTLWVGLGGSAASMVLAVPAWPMYNRNPINWLPVGGKPLSARPQTVYIDPKML